MLHVRICAGGAQRWASLPRPYEGELWKRELENVLMPMIDVYDVVVVEDTKHLIHW